MANRRLNAVITIGGAVASTLTSALGSTRSRINELGGALRNLERQQRQLSGAIGTFGRMGSNVDGLRSRYAAVTAEIERQRAALQRLRRVEDARTANVERRSQLRGKIGETAALGAAVMLPAGAAVKRSSEFNYQLQVIGNTADMTKLQVLDLGKQIMRISDETGQSAQTVQGAIGFLVAAGMDLGAARASMRSIGRTATATASDIEDVSRATFTLNDALKIEPAGMQRALDILVQSGKEGNFEFKAMAANLPQLGSSFQSLKMTGTEAVGTMGAALQIARKGAGDEAEAANNLKNFLAKVLSPETLKKAQKLGGNLYGVVSGAQKKGQNPFDAAIKEVNRITKGGDQKLLGELFQDMQVQNFLRPMLQNLDEYQRIKQKALSSDGVVDRDFIKMAETTKQQLNEMSNAAGRAAISIGSSLEPAIARLSAVITPVVRSITSFVDGNQALVGNSILVVGGLTAVRLAVLSTSFAFTFLKGGALNLIGAALRLGPALRMVATGIMFIGRALFMNPIGLAIAAIGTAAFLIYQYWEPIKAFAQDLWGKVGGYVTTAWDGIKTVLSWTPLGMVVANWEPIREFFTNLWADITSTFTTAIKFITDKIDWVGEKWRATKSWLGFGDTPAPATPGAAIGQSAPARPAGPAAPAAPKAPEPPQMATGRAASTPQVNDHRQYTFQITPQAGQSSNEIADAVMRKLKAEQGVRSRGLMYDAVTP